MVHKDRRYRPQNTVLTSNMFNIASNREHDISKINVYICSVRRERTRGRITGCNVPEISRFFLFFFFLGRSYSNLQLQQRTKVQNTFARDLSLPSQRKSKRETAIRPPLFLLHFFFLLHFLFVLEHDQTSLLCSSLVNRDLHKSSA